MEANMFGNGQAAPGETPVYEPDQQQPAEAAQQTPEPQQSAPETSQSPEAPEDPVLAAINGLRGEVESLKQQGQPQSDPEVDLLTALNQEAEGDLEPEPQYQQPDSGQQQGDPEAQRQLEALEQLIDERADQKLAPFREQQAAREMLAVQERHPDIMEEKTLSAIAEELHGLEARTGVAGLSRDPQMVEQMYLLVKAKAADAGAVAPADAGGAVLETDAGQTQTGGSSPEDEYLQQVFGGQQRTPSVFG